ncbi:hypothetical protein [Muribaculum intestinale]|uniref:hypothetical protein n=1 Tax=Muribaculum intestinale TaxID=1796646 RepID=UPI0025A967D4|nr:hypothetical protein [Muribaculum intestinale]
MPQQKTNCVLATALRVIGVLNVIGGIIMGYNLCKEVRPRRYWSDTIYHYDVLIIGIFVGVAACIICFALAKCVQAATTYLNSVAPEEKPTNPLLKGTIFDKEPTKD